ncbi:outer membrane protein assembly factor BamB family protein [Halorubellus salinus]|uniref:outer membrane protein assembly factor BamB family protein n=1 Tax=Halorubellus salinus TaxID=755309 RepID=UPI001D07F6AF|nr:PQQ-binding-like beta-propeller repeat protein [Halorubellus salinus]
MRAVTVVAVAVVLASLAGAVLLGATGALVDQGGSDLSTTWTSDSAIPSDNNHHEVAVGTVGGEARVFVPVSSTRAVDACALAAFDADDGGEAWRDSVPSANCTVHAVADVAVADYDRDDTTEVLATTTEQVVRAYAPGGDVEREWNLSAYGYTKPVVANVTGDAAPEVVVVDSRGLVQVLDADGGVAWRDDRDGYVWGSPVVDDVDGDGAVEVVVADSTGAMTAYTATGGVDWNVSLDGEAVTWLGHGDADADGVIEFYAGTPTGFVFAVDGTGERAWTTTRSDLTATNAVLRDDAGGGAFVASDDGTVARLDAESGDVVWETTVASDAVQMMPPPVAGDVDGDGDSELVVAAHDGTVAVLDPATGRTIATVTHDDRVFAAPVLADVDGDDRVEAFVIYADGTVRRFDYDD